MLTGWGMTAFRIEPKNRLLSGSTTRDSVNPKSLIFDALSGQANSHRLLQRAISFFFCESAIAALASLQARHCTLHYGTLRIVASLLQAAELLTWGGNSRTCPNRATRLQHNPNAGPPKKQVSLRTSSINHHRTPNTTRPTGPRHQRNSTDCTAHEA